MSKENRTDKARTNESRLERAEHEPANEWYRSPLVLLAGLILFAGVIAAVVVGLSSGGDNDSGAASDQAAGESAPDAVETPIAPAFGGPDVPEVGEVTVVGDPLPGVESSDDDPAVGLTAPVVTASSLANGRQVEIGPGKARVIGLFAHWCPHCQAELPQLTTWLRQNQLPPNSEFIAISTAVDKERDNYPPSAWFNEEEWPAPVIVDDSAATLIGTYGFRGFPAFIAIDEQGTVVGRLTGNVGPDGVQSLFDKIAASRAS